MKTKLKTLSLTLLMLSGSLLLLAQETNQVQKLVISHIDNTEVSFLLSEKPIIKFTEGPSWVEIITMSGSWMECTSYLDKMTVVCVEETKIDDLIEQAQTTFTWQGDVLLIDVAIGSASIHLYSIDGKEILSKILTVGRHAFPTYTLSAGVYIIKVNNETIKYWKR